MRIIHNHGGAEASLTRGGSVALVYNGGSWYVAIMLMLSRFLKGKFLFVQRRLDLVGME